MRTKYVVWAIIMAVMLIFAFLGIATSQVPQSLSLGFGNGHMAKISPTSDLIAISIDTKIKIFRSGIMVNSLSSHRSMVTGFQFENKNKGLVVVHRNGSIVHWNLQSMQKMGDVKSGINQIEASHYSEVNNSVVLQTKNTVSLVALDGGILWERAYQNRITATATNRSGKIIAIATQDKIVQLIDDSNQLIHSINVTHSWIKSLAFSPDGKMLAVGSLSGGVELWDIETGKLLKSLLKIKGRINSLEFSSDSKYLAAGSELFWILSIEKNLPAIVYRNINGPVISSSFSPDGKQIVVIQDLTPFAEVYDISDLNIPPIYEFRDEGDVIAPQIYVSNPPKIESTIHYSKDILDISGSIFDDYGVRTLRINGIDTPIKENGKFTIHMPLSMGENYITLEASDINGNTSIKKFVINRKNESDVYDPEMARNFLFAVGIDNYSSWPGLNNAVKDGNDLASVLMNQYDFQLSNISILKDEQATRSNIFNGLRSMIEKVTPQDNLIIYFSGHGHFDELLNEGYWVPVDAKLDSETDYLSNSDILKIIENINSQHTVLIADACFAGSLFTESRRGSYEDRIEKFKSRWGLASGRLEVVSDGQIGTNSPFATVLIDYLKNNSKDQFAVSELVQHVKTKVSEKSGQTPIGNPLRITGEEGGEFVFRKKTENRP